MFAPESDWSIPSVFPQFSDTETIAVDLETYDPHLMTCGPGWGYRSWAYCGYRDCDR